MACRTTVQFNNEGDTMSNKENSSAKSWLCALIIIFSGFLFGMMIKKIAGTAALLMPSLGVGPSSVGSLVSAISILCVIMAIPIGSFIAKFGARKFVLAAFALAIAGNIMGALSTSTDMLYVSRIVEGAGFGIFAPAAPSLLASYFPPEKRGLPMGIWSTYVGAGAFIVLILTNLIVDFDNPSTWANVWWFIAIGLAAMAVLFFIFVRPEDVKKSGQSPFKVTDGLKSLPTWLLVASFMMYTFGFIALTTFMPTYLKTVLSIDPATANLYTSILTLAMIVGGFIAGAVIKRTKPQNKPMLYFVFVVLCAIVTSLSFVYSNNMIVVYAVVGGVIMQFVPAILFSNAPDTAPHPALTGVAMGVVSFGQNLGGLTAGTFSGSIIENLGWGAMTGTLVGVGVAGIVLAVLYVFAMKKREQKKQSETE